jgi:hypothetical protein
MSKVQTQLNIPLQWGVARTELTRVLQAHAQAINADFQAETGSATASFTASNKPGANNKTSPDTWLKVTVDGVDYYVPAFLA